ncbi:MAG: methyltransferase domain-containing protein [Anaerolineae bacterium]|nr:methyltransferase domain-containing protein [Anaerolineae bacterium]
MIDDITDIAEYYNNNPELEHTRLERHQLEYDLTWRYLSAYLPPQGSILEVGAATGRYTVELTRRGYRVTAVDQSTGLIELCRQHLADAGLEQQVRLVVADARNLAEVTQKGFDVALLMGPLYHLVMEEDRKEALKQVVDRVKEGGLIVSSFISRFGIMGDLMKKMPEWIESQTEVRSILDIGRAPVYFPRGGFRGYFATVSEIAPLHEAAGIETLVVAGVEPGISTEDESYNCLEGERRQLWLDLLYEISTEESSLGASRHLLYIGRKRGLGVGEKQNR